MICYHLSEGNCHITEEGLFDWSLTIISLDDSKVDVELLSAPYTGSLKVDSCTNNDNNFFEVTNNETHFLIRTTNQMAHFDEMTPKKTGAATLFVDCTLTCESQSTLPITFQIADINGHDPTFLNGPYSFDVPSPIMQKTDITIYGQKIIVEDLDFTNQDVKFTITPEDFEITTLKSASSKHYTAQFAAKKSIQLKEPKTYTFTATDTGNNPGTRSSITSIVLNPDKDSSFDTPSFQEPQYSFLYEDGSESLEPYDKSQGSIKVLTTKPNSIAGSLKITGELEQYLQAKFDPATLTIFLTVSGTLHTASAFLISTLSVTTDYKATTSIVVYVKSNSKEAPRFAKVLFTGKYQPDRKEVDLDSPIDVLSKSTVDVSISDGDYNEYFNLEKDADGLKVNIKNKLPDKVLKDQKAIVLEIIAEITSVEAYATLVIKIEGVDNDSGGSDEDEAGRTPYVIGISVMAGLLVAVVIGGTTFYCVKLRKKGSKTEEDTEDPGTKTEKVKFQKHSINGPNGVRKTSSVADRRPTGFIRAPPEDLVDRDEVEEEGKPDSPRSIKERERKKSVIFDLNVEEMPIEKVDAASIGSKTGDDSLDETSDKSDTESMANVDDENSAAKNKEIGSLEHTQL
nr:unnamed protein product [Callosobruchus chinensis]